MKSIIQDLHQSETWQLRNIKAWSMDQIFVSEARQARQARPDQPSPREQTARARRVGRRRKYRKKWYANKWSTASVTQDNDEMIWDLELSNQIQSWRLDPHTDSSLAPSREMSNPQKCAHGRPTTSRTANYHSHRTRYTNSRTEIWKLSKKRNDSKKKEKHELTTAKEVLDPGMSSCLSQVRDATEKKGLWWCIGRSIASYH